MRCSGYDFTQSPRCVLCTFIDAVDRASMGDNLIPTTTFKTMKQSLRELICSQVHQSPRIFTFESNSIAVCVTNRIQFSISEEVCDVVRSSLHDVLVEFVWRILIPTIESQIIPTTESQILEESLV